MTEEIETAHVRRLAPEEERDMTLYGAMADAAYKLKMNSRENAITKFFPRWHLDRSLSDKTNSTFVDEEDKKVVLSVRGTDIKATFGQTSRAEDLLSDLAVGLGISKMTSRHKRSEKMLQKIKERYPDYDIELVGHSLGASITEDLARKHKIRANNFNSGQSPVPIKMNHLNYMTHPDTKKQRSLIRNYMVTGDVISNSSFFDLTKTNIIVPKRDKNASVHSTSQFTPKKAIQ